MPQVDKKRMRSRRSIKVKMLSVVLLSIFIITATLGYLSFNFSKTRLVRMLGESIKGIATTAANFIDVKEVGSIAENIDGIVATFRAKREMSFEEVYDKTSAGRTAKETKIAGDAASYYEKYFIMLTHIKELNRIDTPIKIYDIVRSHLRLILTTDPVLLLGAKYMIGPEAKRAYFTGIAQVTGIYRDKDGTWISAFAPISDPSTRRPRAIMEISYKIDSYLNMLNRELGTIILMCLLGFLVASLISYPLVNRLTSSVSRLSEVATELEGENYDINIDVRSNDEMGHLAETFDSLRRSIKKKIEELKGALDREKKGHLDSIVALTNVIELRDPYVKGHAYRVEKYAALTARSMHLTHTEAEKLKYGCFLHDIGKLDYEWEVIRKKDKLSQLDYEVVRKHTEKGAKIIEGVDYLREVKDIILYHQERFDGSGYPGGLKGEEIPLLARIVAVADTFDAITYERPYKPKLSFKEAFQVIREGAGTQFDPKVCEAFLKYEDRLEEIARKHFEID